MMLIVLAVLVVLSAVGVWLANRGSGLTSVDEVMDQDEAYEEEEERDTRVADQ